MGGWAPGITHPLYPSLGHGRLTAAGSTDAHPSYPTLPSRGWHLACALRGALRLAVCTLGAPEDTDLVVSLETRIEKRGVFLDQGFEVCVELSEGSVSVGFEDCDGVTVFILLDGGEATGWGFGYHRSSL